MILFYDTETTGFYRKKLPHDHPDQPHLVQIAAILTDDDGETISQVSMVVDPCSPIHEKAVETHGITEEFAASIGIKEVTALGLFSFMSSKADVVVAHNNEFDDNVMRCVAAREGVTIPEYDGFCTMKAATPVLALPPTPKMVKAGFTKNKQPNLGECIKHFFDEDLDGAHDALVDVIACKRIYFELKKLECQK